MDALEHELASDSARPMTARPRRRRMRVIAGALLAIVAVAVPVGVFANHQFTDVPTSNTFHGSIDKIKTAGITGGCSATKYCPNDPVTRGQMAAFLTRAASRGGSFSDGGVTLDSAGVVVVSGTIKTPGAGFILASASGMAYTTDTTGCPCEIDVELFLGEDSGYFFGQDLQNAMPEGYAYAYVGNDHVFGVSGAGTHTVDLVMTEYTGTATVLADAELTLLWVPFDADGDAWTEPPITTSGQQTRQR